MLFLDKEIMFRWGRSPWSPLYRQEPKWQGVPTSPHTAAVSQQLLLFSNHSLLAARPIIHLLRAAQQASTYVTPSTLFTARVSGLPPHFHVQGDFQTPSHDTGLAIVCGAPCLQFPHVFLCIIIKWSQILPLHIQTSPCISATSVIPLDISLIFACKCTT